MLLARDDKRFHEISARYRVAQLRTRHPAMIWRQERMPDRKAENFKGGIQPRKVSGYCVRGAVGNVNHDLRSMAVEGICKQLIGLAACLEWLFILIELPLRVGEDRLGMVHLARSHKQAERVLVSHVMCVRSGGCRLNIPPSHKARGVHTQTHRPDGLTTAHAS
jgi:hypothetical protein